HTAVRTAEMLKYISNAFHALKVCFANEIGDVCAALGADAQEAMRLFLMDRKLNVSDAYLRPGFAFGGSCLPKDLRALVYAARSADVVLPLLSAILPSNEGQVVGNASAEAARALALAGPHHVVVDLTRGATARDRAQFDAPPLVEVAHLPPSHDAKVP